MKITSGQKIALTIAFGTIIIGTAIQIGVREWYAPDIRYEEGSYYISGSTAVTSLKLINYGHSDAEDINSAVRFNTPIREISIDDQSVTFLKTTGGKGQTYFSGLIPRLVPGQKLFIYFAIENISLMTEELRGNFVQQITYKGGKGKTGRPEIWEILLVTILGAILIIIAIIFLIKVWKFADKKLTAMLEGIQEYTEAVVNAINNFKSKLKDRLKDDPALLKELEELLTKEMDLEKAKIHINQKK